MINGNNRSGGRKEKVKSTEKAKEKDSKVSVGSLHFDKAGNRYAPFSCC